MSDELSYRLDLLRSKHDDVSRLLSSVSLAFAMPTDASRRLMSICELLEVEAFERAADHGLTNKSEALSSVVQLSNSLDQILASLKLAARDETTVPIVPLEQQKIADQIGDARISLESAWKAFRIPVRSDQDSEAGR